MSAEQELRALREGLEALADEHWLDPTNYRAPLSSTLATLQKRLRALLASSPATETARPRNCCEQRERDRLGDCAWAGCGQTGPALASVPTGEPS